MYYQSLQHVKGASYAVGQGLGAAIAAGVFGWLAGWLATRFGGASRRVAGMAFCALLLVSTSLNLRRAHTTRPTDDAQVKEAVEELVALAADIRRQRRQAALGDGPVGSIEQDVRRGLAGMERAADKTRGDAGRLFRAAAGVYRGTLAEARAYDVSLAAFKAAGGMEKRSLVSRETLRARIKLLTDHQTAAQAVADVAGELMTRMARAARAAKVNRESANGFISGLNERSASQKTRTKVHRLDVQQTGLMLSQLKLLQLEWGAWGLDGDTLVFESDAALRRFNTLASQIDRVTRQQRELQDGLAGPKE